MQADTLSPMMQQWKSCKQKAGDSLLLFRLGDFYEAFNEDAKELSKILGITLTARHGIPMSGIPVQSLDPSITKIVQKGRRVAIVEQEESNPSNAKKILRRNIAHLISSGTLNQFRENCESKHLLICSLYFLNPSEIGLAFCDPSTGEIWTIECQSWKECLDEISIYQPAELLMNKKALSLFDDQSELPLKPHFLEDRFFSFETNSSFLCHQFHLQTTDSLGFHLYPQALIASGALLRYISLELFQKIEHIKDIRILDKKDYLFLDRATQRHLSILEPLPGEDTKTLFEHLNHTETPMGVRLLRQWLAKPLLDPFKIQERQNVVKQLTIDNFLCRTLSNLLEPIRDLDRLSVRLEKLKKTTHDLLSLSISCKLLPSLYQKCVPLSSLQTYLNTLTPPIEGLIDLLKKSLLESPATKIGEGAIFQEGWNAELDLLRNELKRSRERLHVYQETLRESLNIKTLKIGFTPSFGYFIEVSKGSSHKIPSCFSRKQTLTQCERFYSKELQEFESVFFKLERQIDVNETELLKDLQNKVCKWIPQIKKHAKAVALIDCFLSLARVATKSNYICPSIDDSFSLEIENGRHPLLETILPMGNFISNSTLLDQHRRLMILTGPNMGGKSTYMRQIALLVIMAQVGSFVPAKKMHIGSVDRVFGRIGAHDALLRGQSTFMVEMVELANILRYATKKSLLILDEIGRGTSTYDGISISQATIEMLLEKMEPTPRTIVSTHYWELTSLANKYHHACNAHVSFERSGDDIKLLYKIQEGPGERSFGIHVARLAGLPQCLIERANHILKKLEKDQLTSVVQHEKEGH